MPLPNKAYGTKYVIKTQLAGFTDSTAFYGKAVQTSSGNFNFRAADYVAVLKQFVASNVTVLSVQGYDVNGAPTFLYTPIPGVSGVVSMGPNTKDSYSNQIRLSGTGAVVPPDSRGRKAEIVFTPGVVQCERGVRKITLASYPNAGSIGAALTGIEDDVCDYRGGLVTFNAYVTQKQNTYLQRKRGF